MKNQQREFEAQQQHRAHVQEFIDRFRYNANRASSVQSKIKMLEKLWVSKRDYKYKNKTHHLQFLKGGLVDNLKIKSRGY